jgi:phosphomevalonate kinase
VSPAEWTWIATAPGKLHLAGEYAVLDGAEAVVCAVDRRAIARPSGRGEDSPFLDEVVAELIRRRGDGRAAGSPARRSTPRAARRPRQAGARLLRRRDGRDRLRARRE